MWPHLTKVGNRCSSFLSCLPSHVIIILLIAAGADGTRAATPSPAQLAWVAAETYTAAADTNGLREGLYRSALYNATQRPVTQEMLADFQKLAKSVSIAKSDEDIRTLLASPIAQRYAFAEALQASGRYGTFISDPRSVDATLSAQLVVRLLGPSQRSPLPRLIADAAENPRARQLVAHLGESLDGLPKQITPQSLKQFASSRGLKELASLADSVAGGFNASSDAAQVTAARAAAAANNVSGSAVRRVAEGATISQEDANVQLRALSELRGTASAAAAIASIAGNPDLQRATFSMVRAVDAGVRIYTAATLLYSGVGGYGAIMEIVSAYGNLRAATGATDSPEDVARANAQALFDYVRAQFIVVNAKLDHIIDTMASMKSSLASITAQITTLDEKVDNLQRSVTDLNKVLRANQFSEAALRLEKRHAECIGKYMYSVVPGRIDPEAAKDCLSEFKWLIDSSYRPPLIASDFDDAMSLVPAGPESLDAYYLGRSFAAIAQAGTKLTLDAAPDPPTSVVNPWLLSRGANGLALTASDLGSAGKAPIATLREDIEDAIGKIQSVKRTLRTMQGGSPTERRQIPKKLFAHYGAAMSNALLAWKGVKEYELEMRIAGVVANQNLTTDGLANAIFECRSRPNVVGYVDPVPDLPYLSIPDPQRASIARKYRAMYRGYVSELFRKRAKGPETYTGPPLVEDLVPPIQFCIEDHSTYVGIDLCGQGHDSDCYSVDATFDMTIHAIAGGFVLATSRLTSARQRFVNFGQKRNDYTSAVQWVGRAKGQAELPVVVQQIIDSISAELNKQGADQKVREFVRISIQADQQQALAEALQRLSGVDALGLGPAWTAFKTSLEDLDRALALMRGYLAFAYPSVIRQNDIVRLMLAGNAHVRLLDSEGVKELAPCMNSPKSPAEYVSCAWARLFVVPGEVCQQAFQTSQVRAGACDIPGDQLERHFRQRERIFKDTIDAIAWANEPIPSYPPLDFAESRLQTLQIQAEGWRQTTP